MKSPTYYFHLKTKMLADFRICISAPSIICVYLYLRKATFHLLIKTWATSCNINVKNKVFLTPVFRKKNINWCPQKQRKIYYCAMTSKWVPMPLVENIYKCDLSKNSLKFRFLQIFFSAKWNKQFPRKVRTINNHPHYCEFGHIYWRNL